MYNQNTTIYNTKRSPSFTLIKLSTQHKMYSLLLDKQGKVQLKGMWECSNDIIKQHEATQLYNA